ncbi:bifunctional biotin--[acetyl-CoA-carboxylase] ligase/biotin operon repressor BirA [soil metagenome]
MNSPLSAQRIAALVRPDSPKVKIEVVPETGSTNADLLARLASLSAATLLLAEAQTSGRGRAGSTWLSASGDSLTFSLAWKFNLPVHALLGLSLAVGVTIAQSLDRFGVETELKWPNDILKSGNKLCGVLIETASADDKIGDEVWAVIGIGLNLAIPVGMEAAIGHPVAALDNKQLDREALMATLLSDLAEALAEFQAQGFKAFMTRWNALHAYKGQAVLILDRERVLHEGLALGVDQIGRLMLDTPNGQVAVMAGDVSLRAAAK